MGARLGSHGPARLHGGQQRSSSSTRDRGGPLGRRRRSSSQRGRGAGPGGGGRVPAPAGVAGAVRPGGLLCADAAGGGGRAQGAPPAGRQPRGQRGPAPRDGRGAGGRPQVRRRPLQRRRGWGPLLPNATLLTLPLLPALPSSPLAPGAALRACTTFGGPWTPPLPARCCTRWFSGRWAPRWPRRCACTRASRARLYPLGPEAGTGTGKALLPPLPALMMQRRRRPRRRPFRRWPCSGAGCAPRRRSWPPSPPRSGPASTSMTAASWTPPRRGWPRCARRVGTTPWRCDGWRTSGRAPSTCGARRSGRR